MVNLIGSYKLNNGWNVSGRWRFSGGAPYTPYDINLSSTKSVWDVTQQGIPDWNRLNTERNPLVHGLDVRIDKKWFFKKWTFNFYLDVQNIYNFQAKSQDYLDVVRDNSGMPVQSPDNPDQYKTYFIKNTSGNVLPSIGLMLEF